MQIYKFDMYHHVTVTYNYKSGQQRHFFYDYYNDEITLIKFEKIY